jgi:serine protease AprX
MKFGKIDHRLLSEIAALNAGNKLRCFIFGRDFNETKTILKRQHIHILGEYLFINSFCCSASQSEIYHLAGLEVVDYISSCSSASTQMFVSKNILKTDKTNLSVSGVGVAFIDTGISPHADFLIGKNRIKLFKDFIGERQEPYDDNGHGTFVAGVCSGSGVLSAFKFSGVAPKSQIVSLKALNAEGEASANKILNAMEWVYDNHKKENVSVCCMSFGSEPLGQNDPIMLGAEALWRDGVTVVAAAGNSGPEYQTIKSPGISPKIITVGGIDDNRYDEQNFNPNFFEVADFSSRGPAFKKVKPDLVAPSVDIISCGVTKPYTTLSGTSVAAPMVAGLVCLLLERDSTLTPDRIKNLLLKSCRPLGFEMNLEGFGLPNIDKIL